MTAEEFTTFYPQFQDFAPSVVLSAYISQANRRFDWFEPEDAEEARRLYVAHRLTMYSRVALPDGATPTSSAIATAGQQYAQVTSKRVDDVQVSYADVSKISESYDTGFVDLKMTPFGLQLLSMLRLYHGTKYIR